MEDKRQAKRLKDVNEINVTVLPGAKNLPKEKNFSSYSKDISATGTKIQSNIFLPIDTLLKMEFNLLNLQQMITAMGKVKWIQIIIEHESYDAGVEFVNINRESIKKLAGNISLKRKSTADFV
jgi:c-di-GMP-binding flagellar brake protein YcgR